MATDYNPYYILDAATMSKSLERQVDAAIKEFETPTLPFL